MPTMSSTGSKSFSSPPSYFYLVKGWGEPGSRLCGTPNVGTQHRLEGNVAAVGSPLMWACDSGGKSANVGIAVGSPLSSWKSPTVDM